MIRDYAALYCKFIVKYAKAKLEYKIPLTLDIIANVINSLSFVSVVYFLMNHFSTLDDWRLNEVMLMFGFGLLSWGLAGMLFWAPVMQLEQLIITGQFDHFLLKPLHPLLHLMFRHFQHTFLGQTLVGIGLLSYSLQHLSAWLSPSFILNGIYLLFNSVLVQSAILITLSSLNFYVKKPLVFSMMVVVDLQVISRYPISIYHQGLQFIVSFVVPYIFVSYYPVVILMRGVSSEALLWVTYVVGPLLVGLACLLFHYGVRRYDGAGS
ncbi:ABC transporter permease [Paenibacillus agilis]|uniref:ABC transporter permease n=1 Tax=Paenibacillus agilis TaxID=3020863 RepID=A0A559IWZ7_9BACL|nr:ABC-2 family transporter protein [Paenibacillus agilis]TVX92155.1 hypothetical protein FPZ44_03245 [Paenibacillus agilis]